MGESPWGFDSPLAHHITSRWPIYLSVVHREPSFGTHANQHVLNASCFGACPLDVPVTHSNAQVTVSQRALITFKICRLGLRTETESAGPAKKLSLPRRPGGDDSYLFTRRAPWPYQDNEDGR